MTVGVHKRFGFFSRKRQDKVFSNIKSADELRAIMRRERCRVDRNIHAFSLAVFRVGLARNNGAVAWSLAEVLAGRMRATDEAGWFDAEHIAVVLDHTRAEGAWKFAADVADRVAEKTVRPEFRIYTYSSSDHRDNNKNDFNDTDGRRTQDRLPAGRAEAPGEQVGAGHVIGEKNPLSWQSSGDTIFPTGVSRMAESLQPYLACRMPLYKRVMDVFGSAVGLLLLSPLFLAVALLIKMVSPGPVFFKQERVGYLGRHFRIWKFRTMKIGADQGTHEKYVAELIKSDSAESGRSGQAMQKLQNDERVIPLGNFLRKTAIDELPQLINVLVGQMSLIGPRPPIPYEVRQYHPWHHGRFDTVPGMTGLWQVNGKNRTTFKEMVRYDITYARRMSLGLDARILAGTLPAIFTEIKNTV